MATPRTTRHVTTAQACCALIPAPARRSAARRSWPSLGPSPFSYSELDNQTTNTNGYGASIQVTDTQTVFGFNNHLVGGISFDGAQTEFTGESFIGGIDPISRLFIGPGVIIDEPGSQRAGSGRDQQCILRRVLRRHPSI